MSKKNNNNNHKTNAPKAVKEKIIVESETENKKGLKYFYKSEKEIGFKKRNYFSNGKRFIIEAGAEIDEATYNLFGEKARKAFVKE